MVDNLLIAVHALPIRMLTFGCITWFIFGVIEERVRHLIRWQKWTRDTLITKWPTFNFKWLHSFSSWSQEDGVRLFLVPGVKRRSSFINKPLPTGNVLVVPAIWYYLFVCNSESIFFPRDSPKPINERSFDLPCSQAITAYHLSPVN